MFSKTSCAILFALASVGTLTAQSNARLSQPEPDVLIFTDGEKLIGKLESSSGASVVFKSNMAGELTIDWNKIKELHSSRHFAVAEKGMRFGRRYKDLSEVPQGTVNMTDQTLEIKQSPE